MIRSFIRFCPMKKTDFLASLTYPVLLVIFMIVLHIIGGTVQLDIASKDAQRDFNTAIGTSLLSGVFLLSIRIIQRSVARHLSLILGLTKRHQNFWIHRKILSDQFKKHLVWSASFGFIMPLLYMMTEGLISRINEKEVFIVAVGAIPFWLLLSLYLFQITTVNRHLRRFLNTDGIELIVKIKMYESVLSVATLTITTSLLIFLVMPVFWINLSIHLFDMIFIFAICLFLVILLVSPLISYYGNLREAKQLLATDLDKRIEYLIRESVISERSKEIEYLLGLKERYCSV